MRMKDEFGEPDFQGLDRASVQAALRELRHRSSFHTYDLATHSILRAKHRVEAFDPGFRDIIEAWLMRNGFSVGVRL